MGKCIVVAHYDGLKDGIHYFGPFDDGYEANEFIENARELDEDFCDIEYLNSHINSTGGTKQ